MLIVGLGNPGKKYHLTRHNLGFRSLDKLVEKWNIGFKSAPGIKIAQKDSNILLKPQTFINSSGKVVKAYCIEKNILPEELLVICDDYALKLGTIRLRLKGTSGGHKGLQSIITELGTTEFPRLRLGIGPLPENVSAQEFVLENFTQEEMPIVGQMLTKVVEVIGSILTNGLVKTMELVNRKVDK